MSMEFFAWPWADGFFGADARKFRYSHLAGALTFIPYGTMVDHFQHIVYEHPELTPGPAPRGMEKAGCHLSALDASGRRDPASTARVSTGSARCTFIRARSTTSTTVWPRPSACSSGRCCKKGPRRCVEPLHGLHEAGRQPHLHRTAEKTPACPRRLRKAVCAASARRPRRGWIVTI